MAEGQPTADGCAGLATCTDADGAAGGSVQCHLVLGIVVDALDDINLAPVDMFKQVWPENFCDAYPFGQLGPTIQLLLC